MHHHGRSTLLKGLLHEIMPIEAIPLDGDEQAALRDLPTIDTNACNLRFPMRFSLAGQRDFPRFEAAA